MKRFTFENQWDAIKGQLKQRYAQLTDDDLTFVSGKSEELLARLREKLGLNPWPASFTWPRGGLGPKRCCADLVRAGPGSGQLRHIGTTGPALLAL